MKFLSFTSMCLEIYDQVNTIEDKIESVVSGRKKTERKKCMIIVDR